MPSESSFPILLRKWEGSLAAFKQNAELLASAEPQRQALETALLKGRTLKDQQESLVAQKQRVTQELRQLKMEGKEAARRLQAAAKALLGTDNELLVQFDSMPRRKRSARKAAVKGPQAPPAAPAPQTEPEKPAPQGSATESKP